MILIIVMYVTLASELSLIKKKLINLIETTFQREGTLYFACNDKMAFFTSDDQKRFQHWSCQNVCDALIYLLDAFFIRFWY